MDSTLIREKLHNYLEVADDSKVQALYTIMKEEIEDSASIYTEEFVKELDRRHQECKDGTVEMISAEEVQIRITKIVNQG